MKMNDEVFKEEILGDSASKSEVFLENILEKGIDKGEVDSEIDVKLTSFMLTHLNIAITEYFYKEMEFEDEVEIMELVEKMLYMVENGIAETDDS
jgi:hypothetical protein